jgi:hypothetical protein
MVGLAALDPPYGCFGNGNSKATSALHAMPTPGRRQDIPFSLDNPTKVHENTFNRSPGPEHPEGFLKRLVLAILPVGGAGTEI